MLLRKEYELIAHTNGRNYLVRECLLFLGITIKSKIHGPVDGYRLPEDAIDKVIELERNDKG